MGVILNNLIPIIGSSIAMSIPLVLASVGGSSAKSMQANTASDLLRNRLGMNGDRASLVSVAGGVGLILIGCAGLYLLENT